MSLASVIANGVATIDKITNDGNLQVRVTHKAWVGQDGRGGHSYARAVKRRAIVTQKRQAVRVAGGETVNTKAYVCFIGPVPFTTGSKVSKDRVNPIDPNDLIILPDGTTGPTVLAEGFLNGETSKPFLTELYLGE